MDLKQLREANQALHHQLNQKNDYKMTEAIRYLRDKDVTPEQLENLRHELLTQALAAQEQGKTAESAFNYDYRTWIDDLVAALPPVSPARQRRDSLRRWGGLSLALVAISIGQDLAMAALTGSPWRWQVNTFEVALFLAIAGVSVILTSLFSRFKLERDPDFFTKKGGNRFSDFFRTYGLSLVWLLLCFGLIGLLGDRVLLDLPLTLAALVLAGAAAVWFLAGRIMSKGQP